MSYELLSLAVSLIALSVSGWTLWATLLKRGTVKMTRPTIIFFGPDGSAEDKSSKVFLRFLLYSTSRRGRVVESMFVRVKSAEAIQTFPIWVYGSKDLARGSGIFVGPEGVAANHHFLLSKGSPGIPFCGGVNRVSVVAQLIGDQREITLGEWSVDLPNEHALKLQDGSSGVYFDWGGDQKAYSSWVESKPAASQLPEMTPAFLSLMKQSLEDKK